MKRKVVEAEGGGRGKGRWCSGKRGTPSCLSLIGGLPKKSVLLTNFSLLKHSPGAAPGIDRWARVESWRDPGEANSTSSEQTILHGAGKWIFLERESGTICSTQIPLITQVWGATLPGLSWAPNPDRKQKWEAGRANLSPCCCSWWQSSTWHPLLSPSDPSFLLMISMRGPEILSWEEPEHPQISSPSLLPVQKAWVGST